MRLNYRLQITNFKSVQNLILSNLSLDVQCKQFLAKSTANRRDLKIVDRSSIASQNGLSEDNGVRRTRGKSKADNLTKLFSEMLRLNEVITRLTDRGFCQLVEQIKLLIWNEHFEFVRSEAVAHSLATQKLQKSERGSFCASIFESSYFRTSYAISHRRSYFFLFSSFFCYKNNYSGQI